MDANPLVYSDDTDGDLTPDDCDICPLDDEDDYDGDGLCADVDPAPYCTSNVLDEC